FDYLDDVVRPLGAGSDEVGVAHAEMTAADAAAGKPVPRDDIVGIPQRLLVAEDDTEAPRQHAGGGRGRLSAEGDRDGDDLAKLLIPEVAHAADDKGVVSLALGTQRVLDDLRDVQVLDVFGNDHFRRAQFDRMDGDRRARPRHRRDVALAGLL